MAQYIDKDKVIEYIKQRLIPTVNHGNIDDWERGADNERINFLSYINTLPEELASEDLEEEMIRWHKEHFGNKRDWEKTSGEYLTRKSQLDLASHFAEWQKEKMNLRLQTEYEKGLFDMRDAMMKDAVDGEVVYQIGSAEIAPTDIQYKVMSDRVYIPNVKLGDKVKIIIIKEEQK